MPSKNIRDFCGRPLFARILDTLTNARHIGGVYVDTDSEKIKELVLKYYSGVNIIDRPQSLRGDFVPMNDIIGHDMSLIPGEHFLQTHSTNPLLKPATVDRTIEEYFGRLGEGCDSLFSVTRFQSRFYREDGSPVNHNPLELLRTQDLPPLFEENSNIYIFSKTGFALRGTRIGVKPYLFEMHKTEAVDIDTESDFRLAEYFFMMENPQG